MRRWPMPSLPILALVFLAIAGLALERIPANSATTPQAVAPELPALPAAAWLNSPPLTLASLRGQPVLIEFWTFECSNCRNTLPWLKAIHARYAKQGLQVIAIHSPEFERERGFGAVAANVRKLGISYPVLIDNDFHYWRALGNRFWPAFYLVSPTGRIVDRRIGELHAGARGADEFERAIAELTAQAASRRAPGTP